jgi:hypothetical protein
MEVMGISDPKEALLKMMRETIKRKDPLAKADRDLEKRNKARDRKTSTGAGVRESTTESKAETSSTEAGHSGRTNSAGERVAEDSTRSGHNESATESRVETPSTDSGHSEKTDSIGERKFQILKPKHRPKTPAAEIHKVNRRDRRQCVEIDLQTGERCTAKNGLELHHDLPLSEGGLDIAENIRTLCRDHHKREHHF